MASWRIIKQKHTNNGLIRVIGLPKYYIKKYIFDKIHNGISTEITQTDTLVQANKIYNTIS